MTRMPASRIRGEFADTVNRVAYKGERVVLRRHGKDVAAIVPIEDLALLEAIEDRSDLKLARKALREKGSVSLARVRKDLGL